MLRTVLGRRTQTGSRVHLGSLPAHLQGLPPPKGSKSFPRNTGSLNQMVRLLNLFGGTSHSNLARPLGGIFCFRGGFEMNDSGAAC